MRAYCPRCGARLIKYNKHSLRERFMKWAAEWLSPPPPEDKMYDPEWELYCPLHGMIYMGWPDGHKSIGLDRYGK